MDRALVGHLRPRGRFQWPDLAAVEELFSRQGSTLQALAEVECKVLLVLATLRRPRRPGLLFPAERNRRGRAAMVCPAHGGELVEVSVEISHTGGAGWGAEVVLPEPLRGRWGTQHVGRGSAAAEVEFRGRRRYHDFHLRGAQ